MNPVPCWRIAWQAANHWETIVRKVLRKSGDILAREFLLGTAVSPAGNGATA